MIKKILMLSIAIAFNVDASERPLPDISTYKLGTQTNPDIVTIQAFLGECFWPEKGESKKSAENKTDLMGKICREFQYAIDNKTVHNSKQAVDLIQEVIDSSEPTAMRTRLIKAKKAIVNYFLSKSRPVTVDQVRTEMQKTEADLKKAMDDLSMYEQEEDPRFADKFNDDEYYANDDDNDDRQTTRYAAATPQSRVYPGQFRGILGTPDAVNIPGVQSYFTASLSNKQVREELNVFLQPLTKQGTVSAQELFKTISIFLSTHYAAKKTGSFDQLEETGIKELKFEKNRLQEFYRTYYRP